MENELRVFRICRTVDCKKHNALAEHAEPCFTIESEHPSGYTIAICNSRAKAAGMTGHISPQSTRSANAKRQSGATRRQ